MIKTVTCISCLSKECAKSKEGTFDICQYGISYLNRNDKIETKEPKVPLSTIAKNLRHEINPILQLIIQQVTQIDPTLSTKIIELDKPLSVVISSTVILDNFIQMITGVHEFHSLPNNISNKNINLNSLITTYFKMYSIIKENGRTKNLDLNNLVSNDIYVSACSDFIKYLIAILIDNAWKYSIDDSKLTVNLNLIEKNRYNLKFTNKSKLIPKYFNPFIMGSKLDESSKGFGYGLNWAKTLEANYNSLMQFETGKEFEITHRQIHANDSLNKEGFQEFTLSNLILEKL